MVAFPPLGSKDTSVDHFPIQNKVSIMETTSSPPPPPPKFIILIPYRDRYPQYIWFLHTWYRELAPPDTPHELWFIHQVDKRPFNRGALKNLGFLFVKKRYPQHYQQIVLIFHDVDTLPISRDVFPYGQTVPGVVRHYYGFTHVLGGIVEMCGVDFERCGGFPNYWSWGFEDNMLQERVLAQGMIIDRSRFKPIRDPQVRHLVDDGLHRQCSREEATRYTMRREGDGWMDLRNIRYKICEKEHVVNIYGFDTAFAPPQDSIMVNLREDPHLRKLTGVEP